MCFREDEERRLVRSPQKLFKRKHLFYVPVLTSYPSHITPHPVGLKETECFQGDLDKESMAAPYSGHFYSFQCVLLSLWGDGALRDKVL